MDITGTAIVDYKVVDHGGGHPYIENNPEMTERLKDG